VPRRYFGTRRSLISEGESVRQVGQTELQPQEIGGTRGIERRAYV